MSQRMFSFHYVLTNKKGEALDSSTDRAPLSVLEGSGHILPALAEELFKLNVGDKKVVELTPEKGYGVIREDLKVKVPRSKLPEADLKPGVQFKTSQDAHAPVFTLVKIEGEDVYLDGNHPLADQDLIFDVEVTEVRDATPEEIKSGGHTHGADCKHS